MYKVLVAMSGGVDSSVAAALLKQQGYDVAGVHMKLHDVDSDNPKSCCGTKDARDAQTAAHQIDIPFMITDLRTPFKNTVIKNFIDEYKAGRTPIPCTLCNGIFKFDRLLELAKALGYHFVATGHYARTVAGDLFNAIDLQKNQTYFLWSIKKENLAQAWFPIGNLGKVQVREIAQNLDLPNANKPESMDLCFVADGGHKDFLDANIQEDLSGDIVNKNTEVVLARHRSYTHFTVGQRRGLGIGDGKQYQVTHIDPATRTVYVIPSADVIGVTQFKIRDLNVLGNLDPHKLYTVITRHRGIPYGGHLDREGNVTLVDRAVVTPGQAAVFYSNEQVIAGGWIM